MVLFSFTHGLFSLFFVGRNWRCKPGRKNTESGAATFYCCRVVGPNLFTVFTVFYAHYAEDHLPKSNGRETIHLSDLSLSGFYDVIYT